MLTKDEIDELWKFSLRDDAYRMIVPSDIRSLIAHIREQDAALVEVREILTKMRETGLPYAPARLAWLTAHPAPD